MQQKIAVKCENEYEADMVMDKLEKEYPDKRWRSGCRIKEFRFSRWYSPNIVITDDSYSTNGSPELDGYTIISAKEYLQDKPEEFKEGEYYKVENGGYSWGNAIVKCSGPNNRVTLISCEKERLSNFDGWHYMSNYILQSYGPNMPPLSEHYEYKNPEYFPTNSIKETPMVHYGWPLSTLTNTTYTGPMTGGSITKKSMTNIIKSAFTSKENKALAHFGLGSTDQLNEAGRQEFIDFIFETGKTDKKEFFVKVVEAYKEDKK